MKKDKVLNWFFKALKNVKHTLYGKGQTTVLDLVNIDQFIFSGNLALCMYIQTR